MLRLVSVLVLAFAILAGALILALVPGVMAPARSGGGSAVDSTARIEVEMMRGDLLALQAQVAGLEDSIGALQAQRDAALAGPLLDERTALAAPVGPNAIVDAYPQVVRVADRRNLNSGLTVATSSYITERLGPPREDIGESCGEITNPRLAALLVTEDVGPIRVRMLRPAVTSLRRVFERIEAADPDLYARIDSAGALCVRRIRGSVTATSSHSFGMAVDLNIDGQLDTLGDDRTQLGLTILADFFNAEGWIWGAAFGREDSMHFEVSREKLDQWLAEGQL